jgi:hypothetical protein
MASPPSKPLSVTESCKNFWNAVTQMVHTLLEEEDCLSPEGRAVT